MEAKQTAGKPTAKSSSRRVRSLHHMCTVYPRTDYSHVVCSLINTFSCLHLLGSFRGWDLIAANMLCDMISHIKRFKKFSVDVFVLARCPGGLLGKSTNKCFARNYISSMANTASATELRSSWDNKIFK